MKTVDIKGKAYVMINERIKFFRTSEDFKGHSLESDVISHTNGVILIKATIKDSKGVIIASGLAQEKDGDGFINKTSYVENCETSAWGRALGNLGIGIDASIASAEEVQNAIQNQGKATTQKDETPVVWLNESQLKKVITEGSEKVKDTLAWYDGKTIRPLDGVDYKYAMKKAYREQLESIKE